MLGIVTTYFLLFMSYTMPLKFDYDDIFDDQPLRILGLQLRDEACEDSTRVQTGSCQPWDRCLKLNGIQGESCAYGFGVCCYWQTSCGAQTSLKVSQFVNPSYPGSDTLEGVSGAVRDCRFTVRVSDKKVCQLRLDLDIFQLSQPQEDRSTVRCIKQRFQVRRAHGVNLGFTELCGDNSGQHSPTGCLQYYTGDRGSFRSLGFGKIMSFKGLPSSAAMPAGLDYSVCIERSPNACGVLYTSPGMAFNLPDSNTTSPEKHGDGENNSNEEKVTSGTSSTTSETPSKAASTLTDETTTTAAVVAGNDTIEGGGGRTLATTSGTDLGQEEFLYIPGGISQGGCSAASGKEGKFYGESLANAPAASYMPGPFSVWVKSGRGGLNGTGFELEFEQITTTC